MMECSSEGTFKFCFLGYVIDPRNSSLNKSVDDEVHNFNDLERYLDELSGRFVCIATDGQASRVYLDASGSYSMMYDPTLQIVASSSMLIPYASHNADRTELIKTLLLHSRNGIYPFGLTSRHAISRVLPNHYLSLDDWSVYRHWPTQPFIINRDSEKLAQKIAQRMQSAMFAVLKAGYKPYM